MINIGKTVRDVANYAQDQFRPKAKVWRLTFLQSFREESYYALFCIFFPGSRSLLTFNVLIKKLNRAAHGCVEICGDVVIIIFIEKKLAHLTTIFH